MRERSVPEIVHVTTIPESLMFLRGQLDYMQAHGFAVRAVTSPGPALPRFAAEFRIPITAVGMPRAITPLRDVRAVNAIRRMLHRHRPAIVHAHTPKGGLLGMLAALLAGTPVRIYQMRGLPFVTAAGTARRLLRATERLSCALAHRVVAVSPSLSALAVREGLCPAAKIIVFGRGSGNGVDATGRYDPDAVSADLRRRMRETLGLRERELVVGFVGRLVRDKGVVELMDAWRTLRMRRPECHLLAVGSFHSRDAVPPAVVEAMRRDPRVHLVGVSRDMPAWYATMDVLALPTYREGFPNVLLEAAAMRLPVVASCVPGCTDAVEDGLTGMLVPARDTAALADAIDRYLGDETLRRRHGEAGRARVLAEFRPEEIWRALHDEYWRLLRRAGVAAAALVRPPERVTPPAAPARAVVPAGTHTSRPMAS